MELVLAFKMSNSLRFCLPLPNKFQPFSTYTSYLFYLLNHFPSQDPQNIGRNRGYAFIEYYNHACAEYSKQKMSDPSFKLDDNAPTVNWAESRNGGGGGDSSATQVMIEAATVI